MYLERRAAAKLMIKTWTVHAYRQVVDESLLKTPVKKTLHAMVDRAGNRQTAAGRATLCLITGVRREATITAHWQKAREAGLLVSKQRWDDTSVHKFLIPGTRYSSDEELWGEPRDEWHVWTAEETEWWDSLDDGGVGMAPPWGDEQPPF